MDIIWARLENASDVIFLMALVIMGLVLFIRSLLKRIDRKDALISKANKDHLKRIEARNKEDREYSQAFFKTSDRLTDALENLEDFKQKKQ